MSPRRSAALCAALAALVVSLLGITGSPGQAAPIAHAQQAPHVAAKKAIAPVYSDPIYYPVRQPMRMDCFRGNPGCGDKHEVFQLTLTSPSGVCTDADSCPPGIDGNKVYAMGAGIVDRAITNSACVGKPGEAKFGSQVNIDHGGGVSSRYGHLATVSVHEGDQVFAGDVIGTLGRTGAGECSGRTPYLDFYVDHGPTQINFKELTACVNNGESQQWPEAQYPAYPKWNLVPRYDKDHAATKTEFPNPTKTTPDVLNDSCLPRDQAGIRINPTNPPAPAKPVVANAGPGKMKVTLPGTAVPAGVNQIMVETQFYSVKNKLWLSVNYKYGIKPGAKQFTVTKLSNGAKARVRMAYHWKDTAGIPSWGAFSPLSKALKIGAPPLNPTNRSIKSVYLRSAKSSVIVWKWKGGKLRGYPATNYILQIRKGKGAWKTKKVAGSKYSFKFTKLKPKAKYTVRVKARSAVGDSGYLVKSIKAAKKK